MEKIAQITGYQPSEFLHSEHAMYSALSLYKPSLYPNNTLHQEKSISGNIYFGGGGHNSTRNTIYLGSSSLEAELEMRILVLVIY